MALILNIDTATKTASVSLAKDGEELHFQKNGEQKDHAAWIHVAIDNIIRDAGYAISNLDAIAVTSGPGSYTGLRVGMATAKGLCYALHIPFITESTLKVMAFAASEQAADPSLLFCPMIDARRMEVFTALYDSRLNELMPATPMVLDENSFSAQLEANTLLFFGNGSEKWQDISKSSNARFVELPVNRGYLSVLAYKKFITGQFTDIVYSEPAYTKEFYIHTKK
jgi:tRNA threonylcarbamoyladenosine biosynthesis protein TsaB